MNNYHHHCRKERIYFPCTHPDPEKQVATCPQCGGRLILGHGATLEELKKTIRLAESEIGKGVVKYRSM